MKNDTIEKQILLRESGELSAAAAAELDSKIARDPALQAYAKDVHALHTAARQALTVDGPAASVTQRIMARADALNADPQPRPLALRTLQILSYAAALVLFLGLWRFNLDVQRTHRINEVSAMLTVAGEDSGVSVSDPGAEDLEALAELLLEMEGFSRDQEGTLGDDWFTPPVVHPPTAIQGRNSRESLERIYG